MKSSTMAVKHLTVCAGGALLCLFAIIPGARAGGPNSDQTIVDDSLSRASINAFKRKYPSISRRTEAL